MDWWYSGIHSIIEAPNMKVNISLEILIALSEQLDVPLPKLFE